MTSRNITVRETFDLPEILTVLVTTDDDWSHMDGHLFEAANDLELANAIEAATDDPDWSDMYLRVLDGVRAWVVEVDGELAGIAFLEGDLLAYATVLPGFRGLGLQRRLIDARIGAARSAGEQHVRVYCDPNTPSGRNLAAVGFVLGAGGGTLDLGRAA